MFSLVSVLNMLHITFNWEIDMWFLGLVMVDSDKLCCISRAYPWNMGWLPNSFSTYKEMVSSAGSTRKVRGRDRMLPFRKKIPCGVVSRWPWGWSDIKQPRRPEWFSTCGWTWLIEYSTWTLTSTLSPWRFWGIYPLFRVSLQSSNPNTTEIMDDF